MGGCGCSEMINGGGAFKLKSTRFGYIVGTQEYTRTKTKYGKSYIYIKDGVNYVVHKGAMKKI